MAPRRRVVAALRRRLAKKTDAEAVPKTPPPHDAGTRRRRPRATSKEKRVAFHWELKGKRFPLPLVHGTIGGTPTWMLVDTGANSHVVAGWLARQVGLSLKKLGDLGADHAGRTIATYRVDHPQMTIETRRGQRCSTGRLLATAMPPLIEELGIGAFVSPQRLVESADGAIVLDFPLGEMRASKYDDKVRTARAQGQLAGAKRRPQ